MKFDPNNLVIKLCMQGMALEDNSQLEEAATLFQKAWHEATDDYEKFLAAYHLARQQKILPDKLHWLETSLRCAQQVAGENVASAYPAIYTQIAQCYEELGDAEEAHRNQEMAQSYTGAPQDEGPFYHGTKADLKGGDFLTAGGDSNYQTGLQMNHIYFTANTNGAGLAAALAKGEGKERVYIVEPTGDFEDDPNVTNKKFPGNLTRSYRSQAPLRIIGEETDWAKLTTAERNEWRENVAKNKGEIIN